MPKRSRKESSSNKSDSESESENERDARKKKVRTETVTNFQVTVPPHIASNPPVVPPWDHLFKTDEGFFKLFICATTGSGKTTLMWNILRAILNRKLKVLVYAQNYNSDKVWKPIIELFEKKNINYVLEETFKGAPNSSFNLLKDFQNNVRASAREDDRYLIISDDQGKWNRDDELEMVLKSNRHLHTTVIVSSQSVTDMSPNGWNLLNFCILFEGQPQKKLEKLHEQMGLKLEFPYFMRLYRHATAEKHSFFYVGGKGLEDYRKNFTDRYVV